MTNHSLPPTIVTIFGASGDLTKRKLIPALYNLFLDRQLPQKFSIIGVGRSGSLQAFQDDHARLARQILEARRSRRYEVERVLQARHEYYTGQFEDPKLYQKLAERVAKGEAEFGEAASRIFYLSVPPSIFGTVADGLGAAGLSATRDRDRIVVEKPFGHDTQSSLRTERPPSRARSMKPRSPSHRPLSGQRDGPEHVRLPIRERHSTSRSGTADTSIIFRSRSLKTWESSREGRILRDPAGALRDMVQNHLLQAHSAWSRWNHP